MRRMERMRLRPILRLCVRGVLLAKGPDSSFVEAHKGFSSEPIRIEDEVKDQENGVKMRETVKSAKRGSKRGSNTQAHDTWMV